MGWSTEIEEKLDRIVELAMEQENLKDEVYNWWEDQLKIGPCRNDNYVELFHSIPLENGTKRLSDRVSEINEHLTNHLNTIVHSHLYQGGKSWHHPEDEVLHAISNLDICQDLWRNVKKYIADSTY